MVVFLIYYIEVMGFIQKLKDEVMQSIEVAKDTALKDTPTWGGYTERFAMVMGANASGKSNLLKALDYMWMFVRPH